MSTNNFNSRISKLREKFIQKEMDAILVTKRENYIYLSGFTGSFAYLVILHEDAYLITDFRYVEQANREAKDYKIVQYTGSAVIALNEILKNSHIKKLGFENAYVTYQDYAELKSKLEVDELIGQDGMIESLRIKKDKEEIEIIKKAVDIADCAFSHILGIIKPGMKEIEVAAEIEYFMKCSGARGPSFDTIVASGERSSLPHGVASNKKLENNEVITLDFGAIFNCYCSDMTRTVFLGNPKDDMRKVYNIVLKAQLEALAGAKAGLLGKEIDFIARSYISKHGYEKNFGHGLGHGVGLEVHEEPRLSPSGIVKMEAGMVATVEPGIYIAGMGGVRIEDMIILGEDGPEILTKSSKEMIII